MSVEIVSVGVKVPNPGCGFGTLCEGSVEMSGLAEQFKGCWIVNLFDLALRVTPTFRWADGHRVVPRGTGSRWWATPPTNRSSSGPRTRLRKGAMVGRQCMKGSRNPFTALKLGPQRGDR